VRQTKKKKPYVICDPCGVQQKCPECGKSFWIVPDQIKTSWVDGKFEGYRCPERGCSGAVTWNGEKKEKK
jgi:hypothetical protein